MPCWQVDPAQYQYRYLYSIDAGLYPPNFIIHPPAHIIPSLQLLYQQSIIQAHGWLVRSVTLRIIVQGHQ